MFSRLVPPNIAGVDEAQDFTVLRNRQVTLECKSDAVPPPVIMWLKSGEQLQVTPPLDPTDLFLKGKVREKPLLAAKPNPFHLRRRAQEPSANCLPFLALN